MVDKFRKNWYIPVFYNTSTPNSLSIMAKIDHHRNLVRIYLYIYIYIYIYIYERGRVVSDIQTRAEGERLYIRYNTDANVVNDLKNDSSYEFIGEVILKVNVV
jgi:hypothetical protein